MAKLLKLKGSAGEIDVFLSESVDDISPVGVLDDAVETIEGVAATVFDSVASMARQFGQSLAEVQVESAELEFNLQFSGEGKLYVVNAKGQASVIARIRLSRDHINAAG
jgi:hypothetical protein